MRAAIVKAPIDIGGMIQEVADARHGATAIFVGTVRSVNEGREVREIEYTAYEEMAQREMSAILAEAGRANEGAALVAEHRIGLLAVGEASIVIAAAHERRGCALDALRYAIDQMKVRVPIWKRELYSDGSQSWVDPTRAAAT
ncbi:MAG TPA: molybdenum cofactor biosynthesis protein MoaE [Gemmatimonadaceae bacterium]|nr:molybdenum cofactor biosynthesis protein MoaE [Gemmatimonadaceae bacterium]